MSDIAKIVCPSCNRSFKGKPELVGKTIRCPGCQFTFLYNPATNADGGEGRSVVAAQKKAQDSMPETFSFQEGSPPKHPALGDEEEGAYGVTDVDLTPRCPNCANELESENAIVCLHCGYNLATRRWGKTKTTYQITNYDFIMHLLPGIICLILIVVQVFGALYYCLVFPNRIGGSFWGFLDHESTRVWVVIFGLFDMWALGIFAYKRLVVDPLPEEIEKTK